MPLGSLALALQAILPLIWAACARTDDDSSMWWRHSRGNGKALILKGAIR